MKEERMFLMSFLLKTNLKNSSLLAVSQLLNYRQIFFQFQKKYFCFNLFFIIKIIVDDWMSKQHCRLQDWVPVKDQGCENFEKISNFDLSLGLDEFISTECLQLN